MSTTDDSTDWIDNARSTHLCDIGLPGYLAAIAVGGDGERMILARQDALGDTSVTYSRDCRECAPHEQLGTLPALWCSRVQLAPVRCGRRTKSGTPCRTPVARPGAACAWHRSEQRVDQ